MLAKDRKKEHQCTFCSKSFTRIGNLKKHIHTFHEVIHAGDNDFIKNQKCETCDRIFIDAGDLLVHIQSMNFKQSMEIQIGKNLGGKSSTTDEEKILNNDHDNDFLVDTTAYNEGVRKITIAPSVPNCFIHQVT